MIGYVIICCIAALLPAFVVTRWLSIEYTKYPEGIKGTPKKEAAVEKAKADGRFAIAKLVSAGPKSNDPPYRQYVKYKYVYNGKTYRMAFNYIPIKPSDRPPQEMEVYFRKSPRHAKMYSHFGRMETEKKYVFLVLWICISAILSFLLIRKVSEVGLI